ncbi:hypothetical protein BB559_006151, partial [Furculomyces boomerangus]
PSSNPHSLAHPLTLVFLFLPNPSSNPLPLYSHTLTPLPNQNFPDSFHNNNPIFPTLSQYSILFRAGAILLELNSRFHVFSLFPS